MITFIRIILLFFNLFFLVLPFSISSAEESKLDQLISQADTTVAQQLSLQCSACHSIEKSGAAKVGPNLWGIIDRPIASIKSFDYSTALSEKKGTWDNATLDIFLASPNTFAQGTIMALPGIKDRKSRAHIIRFLHTLSDQPTQFESSTTTIDKTKLSDSFGADWPQGSGRDITGYTCNVCHSLAIVKQQGLTLEGWDELIDWMVEEQGMSEPTIADRKAITHYLAKHFNINQ